MVKFHKTASKKKGLPPGAVIYQEGPMAKPIISVFDYSSDSFSEKTSVSKEELYACKSSATVSWINIDTLEDARFIEDLCVHFGINPLTIEDILNNEQRPKIELFDSYIYVVLKTLEYFPQQGTLQTEQVSILLGSNYVITFQERPGDSFDPIRLRLRKDSSLIRKEGTDYLLYALLDTIVDQYFLIFEDIGDSLESMEDDLLAGKTHFSYKRLYMLKRELILMRKSIWPLRELVGRLQKEHVPFIDPKTRVYFGDVNDHTIRILDTIDTYKDMLMSMVDLYQSSINNRMNQVMKVLTIISTIFIPLSFIAGVYGMNFDNMPELSTKYGYHITVSTMLVLALVMLGFFRRKGWL
ncbi:magnesium/cobalt transporter CorA [Cytophagales bacterium LB-30]|uniref:Magnesium transport protein CorA n=1 Tax=Shiella aurantiaca TaxID=3058365 RepID=A0ABT8F2F6_9BACT|nr:magnesium/cobalt transporter CorA [Shiella aurantiaca]MDN4164539.1 magnesium/cobalt transporter CorA [Shiella aurantiaca]